MAFSTAARIRKSELRRELAQTVQDPFELLAEAIARNEELSNRVRDLEAAVRAAKAECSIPAP